MGYTTEIYDTWRKKQLQKYEELFPRIKEYLKKEWSVIDIGIGPAWLEDFLKEKGMNFKKIVGVDPDPKIIEPRKEYIEYHVTEHFETEEKFDLLICFDVLHLIKEPEKLLRLVKPGGYMLLSVPLKFKEKLDVFKELEPIAGGEIGKEEIDYFIFIRSLK